MLFFFYVASLVVGETKLNFNYNNCYFLILAFVYQRKLRKKKNNLRKDFVLNETKREKKRKKINDVNLNKSQIFSITLLDTFCFVVEKLN